MKIYIASPISGLTSEEVFEYYDGIERKLRLCGFKPYSPMTAKHYLRGEMAMNPQGYSNHPASTGHAIYKRDKWMLSNSDVVFVNLLNSDAISIGCMFELAWADMLGKHVVVVSNGEPPYDHAFVKQAADIIFTTVEDALEYLQELAHCDFEHHE